MISGKGLIWAMIFKKFKNKDESYFLKLVVEECMKQGLIVVYTGRESIKIGPPLTITKSAIIEGTNILKKSIEIILKKKNGNHKTHGISNKKS